MNEYSIGKHDIIVFLQFLFVHETVGKVVLMIFYWRKWNGWGILVQNKISQRRNTYIPILYIGVSSVVQ